MSGDRAIDVAVIGSGAGGTMAAKVLAEMGREVVVFEKGRNCYEGLDDPAGIRKVLLSNDELKGRRYFLGQDPVTDPRSFRTSPREGDRSFVGEVQSTAVTVGGGTVNYDADSPRCWPTDFRFLSSWGPVPGAEVVDWPISYEDLEPYYTEVEWVIGVQGDAEANPFEPPRSAPYPMPPGYIQYDGLLLAEGCRKIGLHAYPTPQAVNSTPYRGRPACANCGFCPFGCPINAKGSGAVTALRDALLTRRCALRAECCVTRITTDSTGRRVTGFEYVDPQGHRRRQEAERVIVACNPIDTTRLLLNSANPRHPNGLGNSSGWLGDCLTFHYDFLAVGIFEQRLHPYRGRPITMEMADYCVNSKNDPNYMKGGVVELGIRMDPIEEAMNYPWGRLHKALMRSGTFRDRIVTATMVGEDMPVRTNRVDLDPALWDVWGMPVPRITYKNHPRDLELANKYRPVLEDLVRAAGAKVVFGTNLNIQTGGVPVTFHMQGTARMGTDPTRSVTDPTGRFHDLENLYCADGSTWPTSAGVNPTLTFQALAYWTAANIVDPADPRRVLDAIGISPPARAKRGEE